MSEMSERQTDTGSQSLVRWCFRCEGKKSASMDRGDTTDPQANRGRGG